MKYIPAVLGKGQRGDGLAGSIDDMTLFIHLYRAMMICDD